MFSCTNDHMKKKTKYTDIIVFILFDLFLLDMNFTDVDFSHQSSSDTYTNQLGQENRINQQKTILRIGFIAALISLFLALIILLIYSITRKQYCIDDINSRTISTKGIYTSTTDQLLTARKTFIFFFTILQIQ